MAVTPAILALLSAWQACVSGDELAALIAPAAARRAGEQAILSPRRPLLTPAVRRTSASYQSRNSLARRAAETADVTSALFFMK